MKLIKAFLLLLCLGILDAYGSEIYDFCYYEQEEITNSECETLLHFYDAVGLDWMLEINDGICDSECNENLLHSNTICDGDHVVTICLQGQSLNIHHSSLLEDLDGLLATLSELRTFDLSHNELSGSLLEGGSSLSNLGKLEKLDLSHNELSGLIPSEIDSLSNLEILDLSHNKLTGPIPKELGNLSNLIALDLSDNQLRGEIPPELVSVADFQELDLHNNQLYGGLPKAELLDLYERVAYTPQLVLHKNSLDIGTVYPAILNPLPLENPLVDWFNEIYNSRKEGYFIDFDWPDNTNFDWRFQCVFYGVHDGGLNDSHLITISPITGDVVLFPPWYPGKDIEGLDIHPQTNVLYASSGDDGFLPGLLYKGIPLESVGNIKNSNGYNYEEVDGLSFHPETGELWAWAQGDGLIKIDTETAEATMVIPYAGEVEDLSWDASGEKLYAVENLHTGGHDVDSHSSPDFDQGIRLLSYDGSSVVNVCSELANEEREVEALEVISDDLLIIGLHPSKKSPSIEAIFVELLESGCKLHHIFQDVPSIDSPVYNDIEGIAWPVGQCDFYDYWEELRPLVGNN
jgi:uncharacterized protein YjbI with pentapeptide repeats